MMMKLNVALGVTDSPEDCDLQDYNRRHCRILKIINHDVDDADR